MVNPFYCVVCGNKIAKNTRFTAITCCPTCRVVKSKLFKEHDKLYPYNPKRKGYHSKS